MDLIRFFRHLLVPHWWAMRSFPASSLAAVEAAIARSEKRHAGELRFVVEAALPPASLLAGESARQRAIELFSRLRVWDTEANSGVLVYVQLLDRRLEIVADRGIDARVGKDFWAVVCREAREAFAQGLFEAGSLAVIDRVTSVLVGNFPAGEADANELPDSPLVL